ncbi:hypothetical protein DSECCO2_589880 [anaerobic digester metagenome]
MREGIIIIQIKVDRPVREIIRFLLKKSKLKFGPVIFQAVTRVSQILLPYLSVFQRNIKLLNYLLIDFHLEDIVYTLKLMVFNSYCNINRNIDEALIRITFGFSVGTKEIKHGKSLLFPGHLGVCQHCT